LLLSMLYLKLDRFLAILIFFLRLLNLLRLGSGRVVSSFNRAISCYQDVTGSLENAI